MDFQYCIHFIPEEKSEFHKYTNGFIPHLSIMTKLTEKEAKYHFNKLCNIQPIEIILDDKPIYNDLFSLYSIYYSVKFKEKTPHWCPENPHISFLYSYKPIKKQEIETLTNKIKIKKCILNKLKIVKCNGHYLTWK